MQFSTELQIIAHSVCFCLEAQPNLKIPIRMSGDYCSVYKEFCFCFLIFLCEETRLETRLQLPRLPLPSLYTDSIYTYIEVILLLGS